MAGAKKKDIEKLGFEAAIKELTGIVGEIEQGDVALQESLEKYERGMGLIKHCRGILQRAEERIEKIAAEEDAAETPEVEDKGGEADDVAGEAGEEEADEGDGGKGGKNDDDGGFGSLYD